jgi:hypothetical protein
MIRKMFYFAAVCTVIGCVSGNVSRNKWDKAGQLDGIAVFTRDVESSDFLEVKGVTVLDAPIEVVDSVISDVPSHVNWLAKIKSASVIENRGKNVTIQYYVIAEAQSPVFVSDRDVIINSTATRTPAKIVHEFKAIDLHSVPPTSYMVRVTRMTGSWTLIRKGEKGDKTLVIYRLWYDPAGHLTAGGSNAVNFNIPFDSLSSLRNVPAIASYKK